MTREGDDTTHPLRAIVDAYLQAVGRDPAEVSNYGRYAKALRELASAGARPDEVAHCTAWLASDPYYADQGKPPSAEQVVSHFPGWSRNGRPARWHPPRPARRSTGVEHIAALIQHAEEEITHDHLDR